MEKNFDISLGLPSMRMFKCFEFDTLCVINFVVLSNSCSKILSSTSDNESKIKTTGIPVFKNIPACYVGA